jgi:cytochrome b subunit of formate dehydrogenase
MNPPETPRARRASDVQRFPTGKQAVLVFLAVLALSFTTCMTGVVMWGEAPLTDTQEFVFLLVMYLATFAPFIALVVIFFLRRRSRQS